MNTFIRLLYTVLIAAALVLFIGIGITTFYPAPEAPVYPKMLETPAIAQKDGTDNASLRAQQEYDAAYQKYQDATKVYNRSLSIIGTSLAVVVVIAGIAIRRRSDIIGDGVTLGGIATSVYGITTAVLADDRIMRFIAVTVFLASAIVVVYVQFSNQESKTKPAAAKKS
ncbi:MAG TPA: hypothetical protein VN778_01515 [Verrucomicrobiae bacterium]|nr:hypothetical protein [Verrucomicrobiae bacterium]